jgi:hypothetical protein
MSRDGCVFCPYSSRLGNLAIEFPCHKFYSGRLPPHPPQKNKKRRLRRAAACSWHLLFDIKHPIHVILIKVLKMASNETGDQPLGANTADSVPTTSNFSEGANALLRLPVQGIMNSLSSLGNVSRFVGSRVHVSISSEEPNHASQLSESLHDNNDRGQETARGRVHQGNREEIRNDLGNAEDAALSDIETGIAGRLTPTEGDDQRGLAADAERVRLTTPNQSATLDVRNIAKVAEATLPYLLIVLIVFVYHHLRAVFLFSTGTWILHRCNRLLKNQVAQRSDVQRRKVIVSGMMLTLTGLLLVMFGLHGRLLAPLLLFWSTSPDLKQFWSIMFTILLVDLYIRLLLATGKALMVVVAKVDSQGSLRRRTSLLSAMDYVVGGLRVMFPVPLWLRYLFGAGLPWLLAILLSIVYSIFKLANVYQSWVLAGHAVRSWLKGLSHGRYPTQEELESALPDCPICQDRLRTPLRLTCGHIFCEDCVEEWLARESTCPMCRATVQQPESKPRGDGATTLFPVFC